MRTGLALWFVRVAVFLGCLSLLMPGAHARKRFDTARGSYGDGVGENFFGPAGLIVSDTNGPLFSIRSFARCAPPLGNGDCTAQDLTAAVSEANFIYFFQVRALRDITKPISFTLSAIFDVPSVVSQTAGTVLQTARYGIVQDDQTNISQCAAFVSGSADQLTCIFGFLDDTNSAIDTNQTKLTLAAGIKKDDTILLHIDSYLPPACVVGQSSAPTDISTCVPNDFMTVIGATTPSSQLVVVGPGAGAPASGSQTITNISVSTSISSPPLQVPANGGDAVVGITGTGFDSTSQLSWNGQIFAPNVSPAVTATQFFANVPAIFFTSAGVSRVSVVNRVSGTATESVPMGVAVLNNSVIAFTLDPTSVKQGSSTVQVTLNAASGSAFLPNSVIELSPDGSSCLNTGGNNNAALNRPTFFVQGGQQVIATIFDIDSAAPHTTQGNSAYSIFVFTEPATNTCDHSANTSLSAPVTFEVTPAPVASFSPAGFTFAAQAAGTPSAAQAVTLTNTGSVPLAVATVGIQGGDSGDFSLGPSTTCNSSTSLNATAPGSSCVVSVVFQPTTSGLRHSSVVITDNTALGTHTLALAGTGNGPQGALTPNPFPNFPATIVGATSAAQTVTLDNTGTADLHVTTVQFVGGNTSEFQATGCANTTVSAGGSCAISIVFGPTASGSQSSTLQVSDDAQGSPQTLSVSGAGTDFSLPSPSDASTMASTTAGHGATFTIPLSSTNGFAGAVDLSCTGAPSGTTCQVPSSVNLTAGGSTSVQVMIVPNATGDLVPTPRWPSLERIKLVPVVCFLLLLQLWLRAGNTLRSRPYICCALCLVFVLAIVGCGGGTTTSGGGPGGGTSSGSPQVGTYTINLTATAAGGKDSHTLALTLKVTM